MPLMGNTVSQAALANKTYQNRLRLVDTRARALERVANRIGGSDHNPVTLSAADDADLWARHSALSKRIATLKLSAKTMDDKALRTELESIDAATKELSALSLAATKRARSGVIVGAKPNTPTPINTTNQDSTGTVPAK